MMIKLIKLIFLISFIPVLIFAVIIGMVSHIFSVGFGNGKAYISNLIEEGKK